MSTGNAKRRATSTLDSRWTRLCARLRWLLLPLTMMALSGCDRLAERFVDLLVAVIFLALMGVANLLALIGIAVSASIHNKGRRSWVPLVLAAVLIAGCMLLGTVAHAENSSETLGAFLLHGTLLPVAWLVGSVVSPLTVRRGIATDPSSTVRRGVAAGGAIAILAWFAFVTLFTGSLQASYTFLTTPPPPPMAPEPLEIKSLHIADGYGCAQTNLGIYCWPELQRIKPDMAFAMAGSQICTADLSSIECRDLRSNKRLMKIPHRVRGELALGSGGGCVTTWHHGTLCWQKSQPVHPIAKTTTVWSLAVADEQACGQFQSPAIGCWSLSDQNTPTPTPVAGFEYASHVQSGHDFFCAEASKRLRCWGKGRAILSGPTSEPSDVPVAVGMAGLDGYSVGTAHACGIDAKHALWCWGSAAGGALGNGAFDGVVIAPIQVKLPGPVKWVHAGHHASCVELLHSVEHYCWGMNDQGQLPVDAAATTSCAGARCVPVPSKVVLRVGGHEN